MSLLQALAHPGHGFGQAFGLGGFEDVVDRAVLKRFDRVLVVGGDEHDFGGRGVLFIGPVHDGARRVDAVQGGHADVKEHHIRVPLFDRLQRLLAVARLRFEAQFGPGLLQGQGQLVAHQALVVGQDGPGWPSVHAALLSLGAGG